MNGLIFSLGIGFCGASEAKSHIGITLSIVCLSVRLSSFAFADTICVLRGLSMNSSALKITHFYILYEKKNWDKMNFKFYKFCQNHKF